MFKKLTDHVYLFPAGINDRPNIVLIVSSESSKSLLWEAGFSASHVAEIKHALTAQNLPLPDYIVLSHGHADHVLGCSAWEGIPVICGTDTSEILRKMSTWGWSESEMQLRVETGEELAFIKAMITQEFQNPEHEIKVVTADIVFKDRLEIALGADLHIDLIHCVSPHCSDSILAFVREDKLLLISDSAGKNLHATAWVYNGSFRESTKDIPYDQEKVKAYLAALNEIPFLYHIDGHTPSVGYRENLFRMLHDIT